MNELIKEIESQCWETKQLDENPHSWYITFNSQKFAELIVRECADHLEVEYGQSALTGNAAAKSVKQHFGVEE